MEIREPRRLILLDAIEYVSNENRSKLTRGNCSNVFGLLFDIRAVLGTEFTLQSLFWSSPPIRRLFEMMRETWSKNPLALYKDICIMWADEVTSGRPIK